MPLLGFVVVVDKSMPSITATLLSTGMTVVAGVSIDVKNDRGDGFVGGTQHTVAAAMTALGSALTTTIGSGTTECASDNDVAITVDDLHAGFECCVACTGSAIVARFG